MQAEALHADTSVDPSIIAAVGDVARPSASIELNRDLQHLPGQSGIWPALTNLYGALRYGAPHFCQQGQLYGPVYRHMMAFTPAVFVTDPDALGMITRNEDRAWSASLAYRSLFAGLTPGVEHLDFLGTFDFELHRDLRKQLQPAFSQAAIEGYLTLASSAYEVAIERWLAHGRVRFKP